MDDVKVTVGCMVVIVIIMLELAACVIIGHFFGYAIGLAVLLFLTALLLLWLACAYYKTGGDAS